jgi:hypothetical protein
MVDRIQMTLEALHHRTGRLVVFGNRLLAAIVLLGAMFCLISLMTLSLLQNPEKLLHTQAFMMNYTEFSQTESEEIPTSTLDAWPNVQATDPNWDGMLAGAGIGATFGQNIPLIGCIGGPIIGAIIGYQLDSRI